MARSIWKGYITFGLVMIPVELRAAEEPTAELDLDMLDSRDLSRIRFVRVNESTGKETPWEQIVKGYKVDGRYVVVEKEDFERAAAGVSKGIEIVEFVDAEAISPLYYEKPYYVAPAKRGEKVYALLREALKKTNRVGIAKAVIRTRQRMAALTVIDDALALITMRFAEEVRTPEQAGVPEGGKKATVSSKELQLAEKLIADMSAEWQPDEFHDEYTGTLRKAIQQRAKAPPGKKLPAPPKQEEPPESYKIMDLLKKSVEAGGRGRTASKPAAKSRHTPVRRRKAG